MALFSYKVMNGEQIEEGELEAEIIYDAARILRARGLRVLRIREKHVDRFQIFLDKISKISKRPLGAKKIAIFCRQIAILLETEPITKILKIMEEEGDDPEYISIIQDIRQEIEDGYPLYKALSIHEDSFSKNVVSLIQAGEKSGELKEILEKVANYLEKMSDAKEKLQSALIYPAFLSIAAGGLLFLMFFFIFPAFQSLFENLQVELPLLTKILMSAGGFVSKNIALFMVLVVFAAVNFVYMLQNEEFRETLDARMLKIPVFGELLRHIICYKIFVTIALLIRGGFRIDEALNMAKDVADNLVFKKFLKDASINSEAGHSMSTSFREFTEIPNVYYQLISAGEKSGHLEEMLLKSAEISDQKITYALKRIEALITPVITLFIGVVVFIFVLAVVLPIFELTSAF